MTVALSLQCGLGRVWTQTEALVQDQDGRLTVTTLPAVKPQSGATAAPAAAVVPVISPASGASHMSAALPKLSA